MKLVDIFDYKYYKTVCILYLIFIIIIFNTNILSYIFGNNISDIELKLFSYGILVSGLVFLIIYPFIKIKLYELSTKKNLNKEKLYDPLQTIKINKNIENILYTLNELLPILFMIGYIYLCIYNNHINAISYFLIGISIVFIIKGVLSFSTILPDSSGKCQIKLLSGGCNDLLCSGHFSIVFLIYLLMIKYKLVNKNMNNSLLLLVILYGTIPIVTKKHYTVDVLVAIIVVLLVNNYIPKK
tara:strand:- start:6606 stop:7328 length:723 start_codon:yes stop_codon:yes gene_type:complete